MAFIHTNFLTGNDTTGDGTTSLPYKTVYKAMRVAASNDFIKVAGGQWSSALSGTFTFTFNSNTVTTSVSQVGVIQVDDVLSFEDGQFGFDKFHVKVLTVTAGNITTALFWPGPTITTDTVKRIETYHYSQVGATPNQFEDWSTTDVQPNGRTGITISGGWSNDYTTQGGWTVARRTGQGGTTGSVTPYTFNFSVGIGSWGQDLIWDRFLVNTNTLFQLQTSTNAQSFAIGELAATRGAIFHTIVITNGFGLWQANPAVPSKIYITSPGTNTAINRANASFSVNTSQPETFNADIYATLSYTTAGTAANQNGGMGMFGGSGLAQSFESSKNQINFYLRQNYTDTLFSGLTAASYPGNTSPITTGAGTYIKNLYIYQNAPGYFINSIGNTSCIIENIQYLGDYASQTCCGFFSTGNIFIDLSAAGKTIDQFKPGTGSAGVYQGAFTETEFTRICGGNANVIQVKDSEGLKTLDTLNNIYFKTGGNLKISSATSFSTNNSVFYAWKMIGVTDKPSAEFTVSFTLKVDTGKTAEWDKLAIQYGPLASQVIEQSLTPTDAFATYTMTVDPADYSDWSDYKNPIYFGIRSKTANVYNSETMSYCYIQSVTIA